MKVAVVGGHWSAEIGNAYETLGAKWLVESIVGKDNTYLVPAPPCWRLDVTGDFDLIGRVVADMVIFVNCPFEARIKVQFEKSLKLLAKRGVRIAYVSASLPTSQTGLENAFLETLMEYRPAFVFTRDQPTYVVLKKAINTEICGGISAISFLNDAVRPPQVDMGEYYVFSFNQRPKEAIELVDGRCKLGKEMRNVPQQDTLNNHPVIHFHNSFGEYKQVYRLQNTYSSDLPWGYLALIAGAKAIVSDHGPTCAAALALGSTVHHLSQNGQSAEAAYPYLGSMGALDLHHGPIQIAREHFKNTRTKMEAELRACFDRY